LVKQNEVFYYLKHNQSFHQAVFFQVLLNQPNNTINKTQSFNETNVKNNTKTLLMN